MPAGATVTSDAAIRAPATAAVGAPGRRSCGLSSARNAAGNIASMPRSRGSPSPPPASAPASVPAFQHVSTARPVSRKAARARAGESWAQEALFRRHARMAIGLAHRLLPRDPEVDDLVQDCFVLALRRLSALENPQAFAAWLESIVVRTVGKRLRRRRLLARLGLQSPEEIDPEAIAAPAVPGEVAVELRRVYAVIAKLPADARVALVLRRVEGLEVPEIAQRMGVGLSTVKRRLKKAEEILERSRTE